MRSDKGTATKQLLASAGLFCFFALGVTTTGYAQALPSASSPAASSNPYAVAGEQFLLKLQQAFLQPKPPPTFNLPVYAETINPNNGTQSTHAAFLFTQDQVIRAFYWGTQVDPGTFKQLLATSVDQTKRYQGGCGPGFGTTPNATCFFDDNSQLGGTLTDIYLDVLPTTAVYGDASDALTYVLNAASQDPHGGVPQVPANLGQGDFYMNPVLQIGHAAVELATRYNDSDLVTIGQKYFNEVNDPALGLINSGGLFIGGTQFINGAWQPNKVGPLAGESGNVTKLALNLYEYSGDPAMLQYAENLMNLMVARWIAPNGGVSQEAVNGGYAIVDTLCELYQQDHNQAYYNDAKSIVDFLLNNSRDTAGYFPNGTTAAGDWNVVRTGQPPDASTTLLTQAATAAAILEFAYIDIHKNHQTDVNADGTVNSTDFNLVLQSLGKSSGQPGYRPSADVNDDGVVNSVDLVLVAEDALANYQAAN